MNRAGLALIGLAFAVASLAAVQQAPPSRDAQVRDPQTQPRDAQGQKAAGTAVISGTILSDEASPEPVRHARVVVSGADSAVTKTAYTNDRGQFALNGLPASRYMLQASKPGWARAAYGARRPDRPGTPITLADGQQLTGVTLRMPRGGVIAGMITDDEGQPAFGVQVRVMQYRMVQGQRTLVPFAGGSPLGESTDDRGMYRLYGLSPGEYIVSASPRLVTGGDVRAMTDDEIRAATLAMQQPAQPRPADAAAGGVPPGTPQPQRDEGTTVSYTQVYYPGTTHAANAGTITLAAGEERSGVDFQLQLVRTAKVEGMISGPAGVPLQSVQLMMVPSGPDAVIGGPLQINRAPIGPDGKFSFSAVPPGQYTITARSTPAQTGRGGAPAPMSGAIGFSRGSGGEFTVFSADGGSGPTFWAQTDVAVDGQKISDVSLALQPGMKVSGKMEFRGSRALPPTDLTRVRLSMTPANAPGMPMIMIGMPGAIVDASGTFTFDGVTPGKYRISAIVPLASGAAPGPRWALKSALVKGRDVLDFPLDIGPNDSVSDALLTFSDAVQEVGGSLQDASGRPAPDFTIVVFPDDKAYWTAARRIRVTRPGTDGHFTVSGLPAGEYRMAAVVDIAPGEEFDPTFLEQLVAASYRFALAEGEKKVQDLRIAGGRP